MAHKLCSLYYLRKQHNPISIFFYISLEGWTLACLCVASSHFF
uniref:Uncharacterized protein n=1 Tax=Anguilla anguilla TaxID=7936 RepID=A0A0E9SEQ2_ANGAN